MTGLKPGQQSGAVRTETGLPLPAGWAQTKPRPQSFPPALFYGSFHAGTFKVTYPDAFAETGQGRDTRLCGGPEAAGSSLLAHLPAGRPQHVSLRQ